MRIINISETPAYCGALRVSLPAGGRSSDGDALEVFQRIGSLIRSCGSKFALRLGEAELKLLERLSELNARGQAFKGVTPRKTSLDVQAEAAAAEARAKDRLLEEARAREDAINAETTYASRKDIDQARGKADTLSGNVVAKKLASTGAEPVSLKDLMGDNKFIEENLRHSGIRTALASDDGWDAKKVAESNAGKEVKAETKPVNPSTPTAAPASTAKEDKALKATRTSKPEKASKASSHRPEGTLGAPNTANTRPRSK